MLEVMFKVNYSSTIEYAILFHNTILRIHLYITIDHRFYLVNNVIYCEL